MGGSIFHAVFPRFIRVSFANVLYNMCVKPEKPHTVVTASGLVLGWNGRD